jgi:hypothetical protein
MLRIIQLALVLLYLPLSSGTCSGPLDGLVVMVVRVVISLRLFLMVMMRIFGMIVINDLMSFAFGTGDLMMVPD